LEEKTAKLFSLVPNINRERPKLPDNPWPKECLGKLFQVMPVEKRNWIEFTWIIENLYPFYKKNPGGYLSSLLGHEGENSLLSLLRDEGLASALFSWKEAGDNSHFFEFGVKIDLTKAG